MSGSCVTRWPGPASSEFSSVFQTVTEIRSPGAMIIEAGWSWPADPAQLAAAGGRPAADRLERRAADREDGESGGVDPAPRTCTARTSDCSPAPRGALQPPKAVSRASATSPAFPMCIADPPGTIPRRQGSPPGASRHIQWVAGGSIGRNPGPRAGPGTQR